MSAAWTCHLVVQATRSAYLAAGYRTDRDFYSNVGLSEKIWKNVLNGSRWVTVEQIADLVAIFGPAFAASVGSAFAQMAAAQHLRQDGSGRTRRRSTGPTVLTTRQRSRESVHAKSRPGTETSDAFWDSLTLLSERHSVAPPTELHITQSDEPWISGTPGGPVLAGVQDLDASEWLIVNGHLQLGLANELQVDLAPSEVEGDLTFQAAPSTHS